LIRREQEVRHLEYICVSLWSLLLLGCLTSATGFTFCCCSFLFLRHPSGQHRLPPNSRWWTAAILTITKLW